MQRLGDEDLKRQVAALFGLLSDLHGSDKLVLRAGKLDALQLIRSPRLRERVLGLERLVFEDPTIDELPRVEEIPPVLEAVQNEMAEQIARKNIEDKIERRVNEKMQARHEEYLKEIKLQVLKDDGGPDNAETLRKYAELEKLETRKLSKSALEALRPRSVEEVVGQERATRALFAKIASPYPQHVILYGPPGVGKTTVARLALLGAKTLPYTPFAEDARFVEVDGATLRWDPREVTNPLLGSVHDPIYQGARREFAEGAIPEPRPGLVTEAHGGVLFIDEIGEMDPILQGKLLKVLEDKRVRFESAYYDPDDPHVPKYIKKLFEEGAPADFILVGATTRDPSEVSPALRSRCAEVFFDPLTQTDIEAIIRNAACRLQVDCSADVPAIAGEYTTDGRKATNILADAYGLVLFRMCGREGAKPGKPHISADDIYEVVQAGRLSPNVSVRASSGAEVGHVLGLGVNGFVGSVVEIEAVAFKARMSGKGTVRFNETAGSMAKDSVFNAASLIRRFTGEDISDYDLHINVVGGGRIDGPSAGTAIFLAAMSAIQGRPVRQDLAVTGEVSLQGKVKSVGGLVEKLYGAKQAGVKKVFIPTENHSDVPRDLAGVEVVPVSSVAEMLQEVFSDAEGARPAPRSEGRLERKAGYRPRGPVDVPPPEGGVPWGA